MAFSDNIRKLRTEKGFTQSEMAEAVGVLQGTYCHYELGSKSPTVTIGVAIAKKLGTTVEALVYGKGDSDDKQAEV